MVSGPGKSDSPRIRISHLTVVPNEGGRTVSLSNAIRRVTDQIAPPVGFRIFNRVEFTTCERLAKEEKQDTLSRAVVELKSRIRRNPNYLAPTAENFRIFGVETITFALKLTQRGVALSVTGKAEGVPDVETGEIPLVSVGRK
jgi:hypothetical protein